MLFNEGAHLEAGVLNMGDRFALLGIVYSVFIHTADGELILREIPTSERSIPLSKTPNHLASCIKADRLLELEQPLRQRLKEPFSVYGSLKSLI
jgi:hypothetical protein